MPCPTCDHTLQGLGNIESGDRLFWCPRCGVLGRRPAKNPSAPLAFDFPMLPRRVVLYFDGMPAEYAEGERLRAHRLGILESTRIPDERAAS